MALSLLQINNFKDIFTGHIHNYGQHKYEFSEKGKKEKGKNWTVTDKLLTIAQYKAHLSGTTGLGIVFVNEDNKCKFAVIDVDVYNQDFRPYLDAIERYNLPLVPFYSKSGGLHIYIFFKSPVKVKDAVKRAKDMSRILGISLFSRKHKDEPLEIFPKQTKLGTGEVGNWINLPYFNADDTKQGLIKSGEMLDFNDALMHIKNKMTTIQELDEIVADLPFGDAPPCLQTLNLLNMLGENSGRNNYLFSFGVYLKKKDESYFEQAVMEINNGLNDPLDVKEVEGTLLSSLRKKDYTYKCTSSPCVDFCDKKVCQSKEYGIGKDGGFFTNLIFGEMTQYQSSAPYYEWQVKGQDVAEFKTLRFKNEDEIIKQDVFLRLCFRELRFLPFKMKQAEWFKLVNQALNDIYVHKIDADDDTSPLIRFNNLFYDFLTGRSLAVTKDQIFTERVYFDKVKDKYYFRTKDLLRYLYDIKSFRLFSSTEIHGLLRDLGTYPTTIKTESGKQVRVHDIMKDKVNPDYLLTKEEFKVDFSQYEEENQF